MWQVDDLQNIVAEIERLHQFFEDWFMGVGDRSIDEFAHSLDDDFYIVSPGGSTMDKRGIVEIVRSQAQTGGIAITVKNVELRTRNSSGMRIATYEEHQRRSSGTTVRISTAGLEPDSCRPGGFSWLFVHETLVAAQGIQTGRSSSK
jgi:hypothetical protein